MYCTYKREELQVKDIQFLWQGVIPYGFPTFINGSTGLGKTNVMIKVAANATRGFFPPAIEEGGLAEPEKKEPIRVLYVSTENPVCEIVYPAFLHNGADENMIKIANERNGHFILCTEDLTAAMDDFSPRLIIIDAFQEHLPKGYSISDPEKMSMLIRELERFTYQNNIALVLIGNDAKGSASRSDANKMLGSGVITRKARVLITVKEEDKERYLKVTKMLGYKKKSDTMIGYRFNNDERLEFYAYGEDGFEPEKEMGIVPFLRSVLSENPVDGHELFLIGKENGFTKDQIYKNLERARAKKARYEGNQTLWYLPEVTPDINGYIRTMR